jgi:hypothetical protein
VIVKVPYAAETGLSTNLELEQIIYDTAIVGVRVREMVVARARAWAMVELTSNCMVLTP